MSYDFTSRKEFKILIVDDIPKNIQILGNILKNEDYQISYALNGREALEIAALQQFDMILLDVMMPGKDGFEVCKNLKENRLTADIPIIFLTARTEKENVVKGFKLGAADYVTKPFNADELLSRVKAHLSLKHQKEQLKSINRILEEKVEERTMQLQDANRQLSSLERAKSDFLNIISHELRTPLNGIQGLVDLLVETHKTPEQEEYINYLKEASDKLVKFSETAILITTLKAEKYKIIYTPQKVNYLIEDVVENFSKRVSEKGIHLSVGIQPPDLQVDIDADLITNCFNSLLDNAIKFSAENQKVEIKAYIYHGNPIVEFVDYGPGFTEETIENIFEFFASTDALKSDGMGLSLAAVKLIMDAHEGQVEILNHEKGGAVVRLIFRSNK